MSLENKQNFKCCKCDNNADYIKVIDDRGYGSAFDNLLNATTIPLCIECGKQLKEEWFSVKPTLVNKHTYHWEYEQEILDFIETLDEETIHKVLTGFFI